MLWFGIMANETSRFSKFIPKITQNLISRLRQQATNLNLPPDNWLRSTPFENLDGFNSKGYAESKFSSLRMAFDHLHLNPQVKFQHYSIRPIPFGSNPLDSSFFSPCARVSGTLSLPFFSSFYRRKLLTKIVSTISNGIGLGHDHFEDDQCVFKGNCGIQLCLYFLINWFQEKTHAFIRLLAYDKTKESRIKNLYNAN